MSEKSSVEDYAGYKPDKTNVKGKVINWKGLLKHVKEVAKKRKTKIIGAKEFLSILEKFCRIQKQDWKHQFKNGVKIPVNRFNMRYWLRFYENEFGYTLISRDFHECEFALKFS